MPIINNEYRPSQAEIDGVDALIAHDYDPKRVHEALKKAIMPKDDNSVVSDIEYIRGWLKGWERGYHMILLDNDPDYREANETITHQVGETIVVEMVVVDKDFTPELYSAMYGDNPEPVAGCLITKIIPGQTADIHTEAYMKLKSDLAELVKQNNIVY